MASPKLPRGVSPLPQRQVSLLSPPVFRTWSSDLPGARHPLAIGLGAHGPANDGGGAGVTGPTKRNAIALAPAAESGMFRRYWNRRRPAPSAASSLSPVRLKSFAP